MPLKPNILLEETLNQNVKNYCSDRDILYLEDETGRVKLRLSSKSVQVNQNTKQVNKVTMKDLVTGIVSGLYGYFELDHFNVIEIIYPDIIGLNFDNKLPPHNVLVETGHETLMSYLKDPAKLENANFLALISATFIEANDSIEDSYKYNLDILKQFIFGNFSQQENMLKVALHND